MTDNKDQKEGDTSRATFSSQLEKIKAMKKKTSVALALLDLLSKDFLRKKFHLQKNMEYSEMAQYFKEKEMTKLELYCKKMTEVLYSGDDINEDVVSAYIEDLQKIIEIEIALRKKSSNKEIELSHLFKMLKKHSKKKTSSDFVNKDTKKTIDKEYELYQQEMQEEIEDESKTPIYKVKQTQDQLKPIKKEHQEADTLISSIDDLDRIKLKIQQKKREARE